MSTSRKALHATLVGGTNNQDRYVIGDQFAVVLDGATSFAGDRSHDPGWYAEQLGRVLSVVLPLGGALTDAVEEAIRAVRDTHGLTPGTTPTSTIALARWSDDALETYVLGDSYVVVLHSDGTEAVHTDERLDSVATRERARYQEGLAAGHGYGEEHRATLMELQAEQARHVNRPGGYWIAGAEPAAGQHGLTSSEPRAGVTAVVLASDGVDVLRHPGATTWGGVYKAANEHGPERVLRQIQDAEDTDPNGSRWPRAKLHDDKTLVAVPFA
ncbi:hypothetical protein [Promicromonospora sp. NPDC060271]|uniref:hypothetical protein n=1 Tax=Promicromonospora sp. NPDC060271 TaxID=3347089 RepID=UPI00366046CD